MSTWIAVCFLVAHATQLAAAQNHIEKYTQVKYRTNTFSDAKSRESGCGWWGYGCVTEYYLEYRTAIESVIESYIRCQKGWSPLKICNVLNPCMDGTSGCQQRCNYGGTNATYVCSCDTGYELETDGHGCKDMDECTKRGNDCRAMENFICQNTSDGYQCICKDGFTLVDPRQCSDLDECVARTDNCNASENSVCRNTLGGYECVCRQGFTLDDSQRCIDIDECATLNGSCKASENTVCQNVIGDYACVCIQGFVLDEFQQCSARNWLATDTLVGILINAAIVIGGVVVTAAVIAAVCVCYRNRRKGVIEQIETNEATNEYVETTEEIYENSMGMCSSSGKVLEQVETKKATNEYVETTEEIYENSMGMCSSSGKGNDIVDADPCVYQELSVAMNGSDHAAQNVYEALHSAGKRRRKPSSDNKTSKM